MKEINLLPKEYIRLNQQKSRLRKLSASMFTLLLLVIFFTAFFIFASFILKKEYTRLAEENQKYGNTDKMADDLYKKEIDLMEREKIFAHIFKESRASSAFYKRIMAAKPDGAFIKEIFINDRQETAVIVGMLPNADIMNILIENIKKIFANREITVHFIYKEPHYEFTIGIW